MVLEGSEKKSDLQEAGQRWVTCYHQTACLVWCWVGRYHLQSSSPVTQHQCISIRKTAKTNGCIKLSVEISEKNGWSSLPPRTWIVSNLITVNNLNLQSSQHKIDSLFPTGTSFQKLFSSRAWINLDTSSEPMVPSWLLAKVSGDFTLWMVNFQWLMGYVSFSILKKKPLKKQKHDVASCVHNFKKLEIS